MPEREDHVNRPDRPDLGPLAAQLQQLAPQMAPGLSRDAILFEAGKAAAAPKIAPWVWPSLTGLFAALVLVFAAFLAFPSSPRVQYVDRERIVLVDRSPEAPADIAHVKPPDSSLQPTQDISHSDDEPSLADQLKMRRDVYRWGVEALPKNTLPRRQTTEGADREFVHWLNVPPGTLSIYRHQPKKPTPPGPPSEEE